MKKLFALLLVFFVFVVSSASAVSSWLIDGVWTHMELTVDGCLITTLYLEEDGKAYFVTQRFGADAPGLGRSFVGSWEFTGADTIRVKTGNNTSTDLRYCTYNMMFNYDLQEYYFRAELRDGDKVQ